MASRIYDVPLKTIDGRSTNLGAYKGQVLLIVNVASKCGLTPQYEGLEKLYEQYRAKGLTVLGFPANEFMGQEPGSSAEIAEFCRGTFGIQFPMFEKIVVKGEGQHPLYKYLTEMAPNGVAKAGGVLRSRLEEKGLGRKQAHDVLWNFEKFLVDRQGQVVGRFDPDVAAEDEVLLNCIVEELDRK